jgi:DNA-directed RNA polymerase subunit RPC12/RpoP
MILTCPNCGDTNQPTVWHGQSLNSATPAYKCPNCSEWIIIEPPAPRLRRVIEADLPVQQFFKPIIPSP